MTGIWRTIAFYASAVLVGGVGGWMLHGSSAPAPTVQVAVQQSRAAHAVAQRIDTLFVRQRDTLTRTLAHWDTARIVATVTHDSIVYVRRDVADATINRCTETLTTCAALHAADSAEIHALHVEIAAREAAHPSRLRAILVDGALLAGGYAAGRAGVGAHLSLRVPF